MTTHAETTANARIKEPSNKDILICCASFSAIAGPIGFVFVQANSVVLAGMGWFALILCGYMVMAMAKLFSGTKTKNHSDSFVANEEPDFTSVKSEPHKIQHFHNVDFVSSTGTTIACNDAPVYTAEELAALQRDANRLTSGRPAVIPAPRRARRA